MFRLILAFFCVVSSGWAQRVSPANASLQDARPAATRPLQSYREALTQIPAELRRVKPAAWTQVQRKEANAALETAFVRQKIPVHLRLKVKEVADWTGMTLYAELPNREGYHIRVFGKFSDDWKPKLATLKKGDNVLLEGTLSSVSYLNVWHEFTLSICAQDCTFTQ